MKILLVGSDKVWAIENFFHKYLNELGAKTEFFLAQSMFFDFRNKSILNRIAFRLGLSSIYKKINRQFKTVVTREKPDIIFIFKGMEIEPSSMVWAKQKGIKLVSYNPDNPFLFSSRGSGNENVTKSISLYDLHLSYDGSILKKIGKEYGLPAYFLPFGFDLPQTIYNESVQEPEIVKPCFLGNPDEYRAEFIKGIADANISIDVFGNDWKKFLNHSNITIHEPVYGNDFWKILRKYRVQLNLMRPHNPDSHNMRTFEVPGVGGILLAPDTEDHRSFFEAGKEIFLYTDLKSCVEQLKYLLALDEDAANAIRNQARNKSLQAGYTYKDRARQALARMQDLLVK